MHFQSSLMYKKIMCHCSYLPPARQGRNLKLHVEEFRFWERGSRKEVDMYAKEVVC